MRLIDTGNASDKCVEVMNCGSCGVDVIWLSSFPHKHFEVFVMG